MHAAFANLNVEGSFEQPEPQILICYLRPDAVKTTQTAKSLFCAVACEFGMETEEKGSFAMQAMVTSPFSTTIKFSLLSHSTKGYLAILRYSRLTEAFLAIGSYLTTLPWKNCSHTVQSCKRWYNCKTHYQEGFAFFHQQFFDRFRTVIAQNDLQYRPLDQNPVSLDAICLPLDTAHSASVSFHEKRAYYIDIPMTVKGIVLEVTSGRKFSLSAQFGEIPSFFSEAFNISAVKNPESVFEATLKINDTTNPILTPGRWFVVISGSCIFSPASFTIKAILESTLEYVPAIGVSSMLPEADEDAWVIVADDSSPQGRKGKAELLIPFPECSEAINIRNSLGAPPSSIPHSPGNCLAGCDMNTPFTSATRTGSIEIPFHFICPITRELMSEPVVATDGHSYEYAAISHWLETHIRSPMTGETMPSKILIPNFNLKSQIEEWQLRYA